MNFSGRVTGLSGGLPDFAKPQFSGNGKTLTTMSITLSFFSSSIPTIKKTHKISSNFPSNAFSHNQILDFPSSVARIKPLKLELKHKCCGIFTSDCGFQLRRKNGFIVEAESSGVDYGNSVDKAEIDVRGESTMPDRFRYLTKEAPDKPVRWPWFIGISKNSYHMFFL